MRSGIWTVSAMFCFLLAGSVAAGAPLPGGGLLLAVRSYIGVGVIDVSEDAARDVGLVEPHGVEICSVAEDSPAERFGLSVGDIVLTYRDERVQGHEHFARLVRETPVGRSVELGVVRNRARKTVTIETGGRPGPHSVSRRLEAVRPELDALLDWGRSVAANSRVPPGRLDWSFDLSYPTVRVSSRNTGLGVELEQVDGQLAKYFGVDEGVLVRNVGDGSRAASAGLQAGDVIVTIDGEPVAVPKDIGKLARRSGGTAVTLGIVRDREESSLSLDLGTVAANQD